MNYFDPDILPEEIWIKILLKCSVGDILSVGATCKFLKKTTKIEYLWKAKWKEMVRSCPFTLPDHKAASTLDLEFKEMCLRLYKIFHCSESVNFTPCYHCGCHTCLQSCIEDHASKVVIDIGNKYTWIVTPSNGLRRHFSMYGIPKGATIKPLDNQVEPQKSMSRHKMCDFVCPSFQSYEEYSGSSKVNNGEKQSDLHVLGQETLTVKSSSGPFCVFCNSIKLYREKKRVSKGMWDRKVKSIYSSLSNGFCADTVEVLGIPNMDIVCPALALVTDNMFPVVRDFISHLFHQISLSAVLHKPSGVFIFCEPLNMLASVRRELLNYLFLHAKVSRVGLIPKPVASCAMAGAETCILIDSGALSTSVSVIFKGRLLMDHWLQVPIGGWHVAENLKQAMQWQPEEYNEIPISYLDALAVKEKCRLSYCFALEQSKRGPSRRESIHLRVDSYADYKQFWRVTLGEELYVAPEMMYNCLELPQMIKTVLEGLPEDIVSECISHIILTGGNTDLRGFRQRLARDLCELMPEFSTILDVQSCIGSSSWSVAMGSSYMSVPNYKGRPRYRPGLPFWLSREEFILYGTNCLFLE